MIRFELKHAATWVKSAGSRLCVHAPVLSLSLRLKNFPIPAPPGTHSQLPYRTKIRCLFHPGFPKKVFGGSPPPKSRTINMDVSENSGVYPQIIQFNRVFHFFHHPFREFPPYFWISTHINKTGNKTHSQKASKLVFWRVSFEPSYKIVTLPSNIVVGRLIMTDYNSRTIG